MLRTSCPECGAELKVPPEHAGKTGRCPRCRHRFTIPSPVKVVVPSVSIHLAGLRVEFRCDDQGRRLFGVSDKEPVPPDTGREGQPISASVDEIGTFIRWFMKQELGPILLPFHGAPLPEDSRNLVCHALESWLAMNGERDRDGRLKRGMICIAYRYPDFKRPTYDLCTNRTKEPTGFCRYHGDVEYNLFNFDPRRLNEQLIENDTEYQERLEGEREERRRKWHRVASRINYTATDRQIHLLLDLGEDPTDLEGVDKDTASMMIDWAIERERERLNEEWGD